MGEASEDADALCLAVYKNLLNKLVNRISDSSQQFQSVQISLISVDPWRNCVRLNAECRLSSFCGFILYAARNNRFTFAFAFPDVDSTTNTAQHSQGDEGPQDRFVLLAEEAENLPAVD